MRLSLRLPVSILVALTLIVASAHTSRSDEDDDDPKAGPPKIKPKAKPKAEPAKAEPARVEPARVEPAKVEPAKPDPVVKKAEPKAEPKHTKPAPIIRDLEDPFSKPKPVFKSEVADSKPGVSIRIIPEPKAAPTATIARTPDGESVAPGAGAGRHIRVRLVDGSTVVGKVRAERDETLVVDCALGQLVIPRNRVSTVSYDESSKPGRADAVDPFR